MIETPQAIKLIIKDGTSFDLIFLDGEAKRYDILSLSDKFPQLLALKDRSLFEKGKLMGFGGVVWNDELDIGAETVFEEGFDVTSEYSDIPLYQLGYNVKQARLEKEMLQEELSRITGLSHTTICNVCRGCACSLKTAERIADALNVGINDLFSTRNA